MLKARSILPCALAFSMIILCLACGVDLPEDVALEYDKLPEELDFNVHVKPILSDKCYLCHGPDEGKREADLRLDIAEEAFGRLTDSGRFAINGGSAKSSEVYHRIVSEDAEYKMPTPNSNLELTAKEKATIIKWIEDGAEYKDHWAFLKPTAVDPPKVKLDDWISNPIDNFIVDKLESEDLEPSPESPKEILLRRVSFDLTGLPPSESEIDNFINDTSLDAYEKQVDRLLASPHYGEKMAIDWMDLARYSDTHGYQIDSYRDVSPWRDWVIKSFNENRRYDQFIEWQIAGDMMENPSKEQIIATVFNRLHPQNLEDGIISEEFRVEYVVDRASTVGQGIMAMTYACARCHDHKYDPISQNNFYELYSFFNNVNESGLIPWELSTPVPTLLMPTLDQELSIEELEAQVEQKVNEVANISSTEKDAISKWINDIPRNKFNQSTPTRGLIASYNLDGNITNGIGARRAAKMKLQFAKDQDPVFVEGFSKQGLLLNGDAWMDLDKIGIFQRKDPFSIGLRINIPEDLEEGVIFHKGKGTQLHGYRGYHLYLRDNKLEIMFAHTWPDNAIFKKTVAEVPKGEWLHLTLTYDGSSLASGIKFYLNGAEQETLVEIDNLFKDIIFFDMVNPIYKEPIEPGIKIGGRWRGVGIKDAIIDDFKVYDVELSGLEVLQLADPKTLDAIASSSSQKLTEDHFELLQSHYLKNNSKKAIEATTELKNLRAKLFDSLEQVKELMVMREMEEPRPTYVLERGIYDAYGEEVFPNVPDDILPWNDSLPKNRLGLAKWLTDPDHPLTARVAVNRYWQNYFGRGIVKTTEDFGNQGSLPSHPELLDWLALNFIESGWDLKALQKLIVMSSTYRQSSNTPAVLLAKDPENVLLARGPTVRLTSEMMRDNALAASGLLNRQIGGESVRSYQPDGLWKMNNNTYVQDKGDKLYRRSLYTLWKRTVPNPTLSTFDQPSRSECTVRRQKTNTPLQALVLLNDPTFLETAKVIGETITKEGATKESIAKAYRQLTGRTSSQEELDKLMALQQSEYENFQSDNNKRSGWESAGEYKIDPMLDANLVAANAIVASVIINSDASITKR